MRRISPRATRGGIWTRSGRPLTPWIISAPPCSERVVHGEDFAFVVCTPAANQPPRPRPGFYRAEQGTYYVTRRHRSFLLRGPSGPSGLTPVAALPDDARPIASQDCEPELCVLADAADAMVV